MKEFLIGAAGIIIAGAAFAQTQAAPGTAVPQAVPVQPVDRVQTRDEVVAKVREHFAQLDTNKDGSLTKEEAEAGRKIFREKFKEKLGEKREHRMEKRDPKVAFDRLDTNKDGSISPDEFAKGHEQRIERRMVIKDGQPMPGMHHEGMKMRHHRMLMGGHMFDMADANKDGRVTLQEATDAAVRHFDMADANRDGQVTRDERRQMRKQMIEKRRTPTAG